MHDSWTTKSAMPFARSQHTGTTVGGKLYVVGGRSPLTWCTSSVAGHRGITIREATVETYDPAKDE